MKHHFFLSNVENILKELPLNYSSIVIRDFNIDWLVKAFQMTMLQESMCKHNFEFTF
jgi:hypothetical protein